MNVGTKLPDFVAEEIRFKLGWNSTSTSIFSYPFLSGNFTYFKYIKNKWLTIRRR